MLARIIGRFRIKLAPHERLVMGNPDLQCGNQLLTAIAQVRNEASILRDTLDYVSQFADAIVAYDDASTDESFDILRSHPAVAFIVRNSKWQTGVQARPMAETLHRELLLSIVRHHLNSAWIYCFDADERVIGDVRALLQQLKNTSVDAVRVGLFDAYMTETDHEPLGNGAPLLDGRRFFGPERRDILMLWRNLKKFKFAGAIAREPGGSTQAMTALLCQHYGKAISVSQWEDTCNYYVQNFPWDTYGAKWASRKGKSIHASSDFGRPLHTWGNALIEHAVLI